MPMTTRTAAAALIPVEITRDILEGVRRQSVAMQLMRRLPNMTTQQSKMPVLSMLPAADFVNGDAGMKVTTEVAWMDKMLIAGEIATIVPIPQAVLADAGYDIWGEVRPLIEEQFGRVFDNQVFDGGNAKAPAEWPQGLIPQAIAAGNTVAMGTGVDLAEDFNQLMGVMETQGYDVNGIAAQRKLKTNLRGLRDGNNAPLYQPLLGTTPASIYAVPTHFVGPGVWKGTDALAITGDWTNAVYALRQDMTFQIFDTGVISDDTGKVIYNLLQQDMSAMRVVMRIAWQVSNPIDIDRQDIAGTFPFAVLKPAP